MIRAATPSGPRPEEIGSPGATLMGGFRRDERPASRVELFMGSRQLECGLGAMPSKPQ